MNIIRGTKKINKGMLTAIAEIHCNNGYAIFVFPGSLSPNDILLKYSSPRTNRLRTPKHIHWAVDLLLKKAGNESETNDFLMAILSYWNECSSINSNSFECITALVNESINRINLDSYQSIINYGEYPIDFLFVLMCLLAIQEKTNAEYGGTEAHMFKDVIKELSKNDLDIFKIMSTAGFGGR